MARFAKLPRLLERVRREMDEVQRMMMASVSASDRDPSLVTAIRANVVLGTSRFMAFVDRASLEEALVAADFSEPGIGVVIAYCPRGGVRADKVPVKTVWGRGEGAAVCRLEDLWSLTRSRRVTGRWASSVCPRRGGAGRRDETSTRRRGRSGTTRRATRDARNGRVRRAAS
jgi:hypothetical protein